MRPRTSTVTPQMRPLTCLRWERSAADWFEGESTEADCRGSQKRVVCSRYTELVKLESLALLCATVRRIVDFLFVAGRNVDRIGAGRDSVVILSVAQITPEDLRHEYDDRMERADGRANRTKDHHRRLTKRRFERKGNRCMRRHGRDNAGADEEDENLDDGTEGRGIRVRGDCGRAVCCVGGKRGAKVDRRHDCCR